MASADEAIAEIEGRRAARKAELDEQRKVQLALDLEQLDELELKHGDNLVVRINVDRYVPDLPTMAVFRLPNPAETKRYKAQIQPRKNGQPGDAIAAAETLGQAALLYPEPDVFTRMCETFTTLLTNAAVTAIKASEGRAEEEGKG